MRFMPRLALSLEKDVDNGKTFLEDEHEFYVQFDNFDFLKNAASVDLQEQWVLKVPKTAKNDCKGSLRIRRVQEGSVTGGSRQKSKRPVQYVMNTKADLGDGPGKRMEVPVPTSEDAFEIFARISDSGMIKHRYHFPVEGGFIFEVDMFLLDTGEYCEFAKIDLEVKNREDEIPAFPFTFLKMVRGDSEDKADKAFVRSLYDKYFLAPNKYLGQPSNESYQLSMEGVPWGAIAFWTLAIFGFVGLTYVEWLENHKVTDSNPSPQHDRAVQGLIKQLNATFRNEAWLNEQKFRTGDIASDGIWAALNIGGKMMATPSEIVTHTVKEVNAVSARTTEAYNSWGWRVIALADPLAEGVAKIKAEEHTQQGLALMRQQVQAIAPELADIWHSVDAQLERLPHPMTKLWATMPAAKDVPGGFGYDVDKDHDPYTGDDHFKMKSDPDTTNDKIPALTKEQVKAAANSIIALFDLFKHKRHRVFPGLRAVSDLPTVKDGWPIEGHLECHYTLEDVYLTAMPRMSHREFFDAHIFMVGALNDQGTDPLYRVEYQFEKMFNNMVAGIIKWMERSIIKSSSTQSSNENMPDENVSGLGLEGVLTAAQRKAVPTGSFAFPKQRKEPLENADHVRAAIARFDQVQGVSEAERAEAWKHIQTAAKKFGVEMKESK